MARSQNRYLEGNTGALTTNAQLITEIDFDNAVNVHGLLVDINIESEVMDANSNGFWVVYAFPGGTIDNSDLPTTYNALNDEVIQGYVWGIGNWMASNQTPFHTQFRPKTSRNLPRRGRVLVQVFVVGTVPVLSNNRINVIVSAFASP